jgi:hypothetical protein
MQNFKKQFSSAKVNISIIKTWLLNKEERLQLPINKKNRALTNLPKQILTADREG